MKRSFVDEWDKAVRDSTNIYDGLRMPPFTPEFDQSKDHVRRIRAKPKMAVILEQSLPRPAAS